MTYKEFIYKILILIFIVFIVYISIIFLYFKMPQHTLWINNCFIKKDAISKKIHNPKIVFVAGSSTLFGVNTKTIEKKLKIPTLNFGIHAGLRTDYILYRTRKILHKGDTVILLFEYQNLTWNGEESVARRNYILTHDHTFFTKEMDLIDKLKMLASVKPTELFHSIKNQFKDIKKAEIGKNYNSDTLNENGDETYKIGNKFSKILDGKPFTFNEFFETKGLREIKKFSIWCKNHGVYLYVSFPSTLYFKDFEEIKYKNYFLNLKNYFKNNNIDVFGNPYEFFYSKEYFYDSFYHLNKKGAKIHTEQLIDILKDKKIK